jgi:hypothetical protein
MVPETQAPTEYLKHPGRLATTEMGRSAPPMIAPSGVSNGEEGPKSRTKPVFLDELCQATVVPTFTQNDAFPLAFGMLGVADAELPPLRFTSTWQALVVDPQLVRALHMLPGFDSEQTYFLLLLLSPFNPSANMCVAIISAGNVINEQQQIARNA